jgi:hypothetical protein
MSDDTAVGRDELPSRTRAFVAVHVEPFNPHAWVTFGRVLAEAGDPHQARECYAAALRLQPGMPEARAGITALNTTDSPPPKTFREALMELPLELIRQLVDAVKAKHDLDPEDEADEPPTDEADDESGDRAATGN